MNHVAHAEAAKVAKGVEMSLRARLAEAGCDPGEPTGNLFASAKAELKQALLAPGRTTPAPTRRRASVSASAPTSPDGHSFASAGSYAFTQNGYSQARSRNHTRNHTLSSAQFNSGISSAPGSGSNSASSSGRTTPTAGLLSTLSSPGVGTSSASAAAAALPAGTISKEKTPRSRTTSLYSSYSNQHRPTTPTPLPRSNSSSGSATTTSAPPIAHAHSMSASSTSRERRSMTPGPGRSSSHAVALGHARSASVAPSASPNFPPPMPRASLDRSTTPAPTSSASAAAAALSTPSKHGYAHPNGLTSAGGFSAGLLADSASQSAGIVISRPPVPPKPRTLSGNSGSPPKHSGNSHLHSRGVLDDRGLESDRETTLPTKINSALPNGKDGKERRSLKHERWFPALLGRKADPHMRPATSMN